MNAKVIFKLKSSNYFSENYCRLISLGVLTLNKNNTVLNLLHLYEAMEKFSEHLKTGLLFSTSKMIFPVL